MATSGESKLVKHGKARTVYVTIPSSVTSDSTFPFKVGEQVRIQIVSSTSVLITKARK